MSPKVDFIEAGKGPVAVLIHSSVAGAGQWRRLMADLSGDFQVLALNLYGYGETPAWPQSRTQTLRDQAELLHAILPDAECRFSIVGHSFGGSVAMKAAALFGARVEQLVLVEPKPFFLLALEGRLEAFEEAMTLRNCIKGAFDTGDWGQAAAVFADYWSGEGTWKAMPEDRRVKFAHALQCNVYEWDAVTDEATPLGQWYNRLPKQTTVLSARDTVRPIREIAELLKARCPTWRFEELERGGHMAVLTAPDIVNPIIRDALGHTED